MLIYKATQRHLAEAGRTAELSFAAVVQWTEQAIGGIKETLVMARAAFFIERQSRHVQRLADCMRLMTLLSAIPRLIIDAFVVAAMVALPLWFWRRDKACKRPCRCWAFLAPRQCA